MTMSEKRIADLDCLTALATPANGQTPRLDKWIEWRGKNGGKYSIVEFEREADQEWYHAVRQQIHTLLETVHQERVLRAALVEVRRCKQLQDCCQRHNMIDTALAHPGTTP